MESKCVSRAWAMAGELPSYQSILAPILDVCASPVLSAACGPDRIVQEMHQSGSVIRSVECSSNVALDNLKLQSSSTMVGGIGVREEMQRHHRDKSIRAGSLRRSFRIMSESRVLLDLPLLCTYPNENKANLKRTRRTFHWKFFPSHAS